MSSRRHLRKMACDRKIRFSERLDAEWARKRMAAPGLNVYRCHFCNGWHVGHRPVRIGEP